MQTPYGLPSSGAHAHASSSGNANVQTFTNPGKCFGVYLSAETNGAYVTFDGSAPSTTNGLHIATGGQPTFFPIGCASVQFVSDQAAAASVVNALWVR